MADKPDVRFEVTITESPRYGDGTSYVHFRARALIYGESTVDKQRGLFAPGSYELPYSARSSALDGLQISAQADNSSLRRPGDEFYGLEVEYDRSARTVRLRDAEEMVKVLRVVDRGMARLTANLGRPGTLAQFAAYAARTLTSARSPFLRPVGDENDWEGTGYRSMDAEALSYHISSVCSDLRKKYGIEVAS